MFADRLRDARKAKRYSQTEVSRMLGVTQQAVGKWETGRSTPDPQTVARLAEILDTTADALLGLQQAPTAAPAVGRNAFSRYTESLVPVVGTVRAGYGALAFEEDYGKEYASVKDPQNYFYLVVKDTALFCISTIILPAVVVKTLQQLYLELFLKKVFTNTPCGCIIKANKNGLTTR